MTHIQTLAAGRVAEQRRAVACAATAAVAAAASAGGQPRGRAFDPARMVADSLVLVAVVVGADLGLLAWSGAMPGSGAVAPAWVIVPAALTASWSLFWRHEEPLVVYGVTWVYALSALAVPGHRPVFPLLVALCAVAAHSTRAIAVGAFALSVVPLGTWVADDLAGHGPGTLSGPGPAVLGTLVYLLMAALAWELGRRRATERARTAATSAAVAAERLQVARELHDIVAHTVAVMLLQAAGARRVLRTDPERAAQALVVVEDVGRESMVELRRLLGVLRRTVGEQACAEVGQPPGLAALDRLVAGVRAAGLPIFVEITGTPRRLDPSVDLTAYRVVQEALTNTVQHAGDQACATVRLHWGEDHLQLRIDDYGGRTTDLPPGCGGRGHDTGLGLLGLRECALAVGAAFAAGPIGGGFRVETTLPLARPTTGGAGWSA